MRVLLLKDDSATVQSIELMLKSEKLKARRVKAAHYRAIAWNKDGWARRRKRACR
jgi:hypothetical protein